MIENTAFEKLEKSAMKLSITIKADAAKKVYDDIMTQYCKEIQMPGFRKGKLPRDVLQRKFGEAIRQEVAINLVDKAMDNIMEELEEKPISKPIAKELPDIEPGKAYNFTIVYDVFPKITLGEYKGITVYTPQVKITKKHEMDALEEIRERNAAYEKKEDGIISADSVVTADLVELDEKGDPIEQSHRKDFVFKVGIEKNPYELGEEIVGMKVGDKSIIQKKIEENKDDDITAFTTQLEITIKEVKNIVLPDLDDELAQDVSEDLKNLNDLRKKVKQELKETVQQKIRVMQFHDITEKLLESSYVEVPESMLLENLNNIWEEYLKKSGFALEEELLAQLEENGNSKDQMMDKWREGSERSIKSQLIMGKINEVEHLTATDDEVRAEIEKRITEYGNSELEVENLFEKRDFREYLRNDKSQEKLIDFLLGTATVKKGSNIDFDDFLRD